VLSTYWPLVGVSPMYRFIACALSWSSAGASRTSRLESSYKFSPNTKSLGPTLSGKFEADQTYLLGLIREAEEALESAR
jgi:hypothetical protein